MDTSQVGRWARPQLVQGAEQGRLPGVWEDESLAPVEVKQEEEEEARQPEPGALPCSPREGTLAHRPR